ncbi:hypothetical protein Q5691_18265 [Microcoleus sp. w1-18aA5]|uniref:hypothetical protein n=1 Tax=unclassified Microcoleus TaxID=2642155 RepID=UPI002FD48444
MTQQNPRELLKQGDPKAIASSINRTLKPKGINADVTRDNGCLHIILEADKVPDQMVLVDFIRTGMTKLGLESIHTVKVYGRRTGDGEPTWEDEIDLMPADSMPYPLDSGMPDDSVGLDDVEPEGEDYYQEGEFDRDDDEEDEDEDEDQAPPPKKQFPKWVIPVGILVPLAAIAGLFFTKTFPFGDSNPEPIAPVATSPSPKPASPASKAAASSTAASPGIPQAASPAAKPAPTAAPASPAPASPPPKAAAPKPDSWREAVNTAQKAAISAQTAQSQNEWIAVASQWQQAVKLMRAVPSTSPNYQKAQQKAAEYQANLIVANRRAAAAP